MWGTLASQRALCRYLGLGTLNAALYFGLSHLLHDVFLLGVVLATSIAFVVVVTLSYFLAGRHVFSAKTSKLGYVKYFGILLAILLLTNAVVSIAVSWGASYLEGQLLAAVLTVPVSFFLSRTLVFNSNT